MGSWGWGWVQQGWRGRGAEWVPLGSVARSGGSAPPMWGWGGRRALGFTGRGEQWGWAWGSPSCHSRKHLTSSNEPWGRTLLGARGPGLGALGLCRERGRWGRWAEGPGRALSPIPLIPPVGVNFVPRLTKVTLWFAWGGGGAEPGLILPPLPLCALSQERELSPEELDGEQWGWGMGGHGRVVPWDQCHGRTCHRTQCCGTRAMGWWAVGSCAVEGPSMGRGAKGCDAVGHVDVKGVSMGQDAVGHGAMCCGAMRCGVMGTCAVEGSAMGRGAMEVCAMERCTMGTYAMEALSTGHGAIGQGIVGCSATGCVGMHHGGTCHGMWCHHWTMCHHGTRCHERHGTIWPQYNLLWEGVPWDIVPWGEAPQSHS